MVTQDVGFVVASDAIERTVSLLEDTLSGKIKAWSEPRRRQGKRIKDLADIARLVEAHPRLWELLSGDLRKQVEPP